MSSNSCLINMLGPIVLFGVPVNEAAYKKFVEVLPSLVQPQNQVFANIAADTIAGTALRVIFYTYIPIFIFLVVIIFIIAASGVISYTTAVILVIISILILALFLYIAMQSFKIILAPLTQKLQTDVFNFIGTFGGVLVREVILLATCH